MVSTHINVKSSILDRTTYFINIWLIRSLYYDAGLGIWGWENFFFKATIFCLKRISEGRKISPLKF